MMAALAGQGKVRRLWEEEAEEEALVSRVPDAVRLAGADGEMLLEAEPESDKDKDGDAVTLLLVVREPLAETGAKGTRAYKFLSSDPT